MFNPFTIAANAGRNLFGGLFDGQPGAFSQHPGGVSDLFSYGVFRAPQPTASAHVPSTQAHGQQAPAASQPAGVPAPRKVGFGRKLGEFLTHPGGISWDDAGAAVEDRDRARLIRAELDDRAKRANLSDEEWLAYTLNPQAFGQSMASGSEAYTLGRNDRRQFRGQEVARNDARPDPLKPEWKEIAQPDGSTQWVDLNAGYNAQDGAPMQSAGVPRANVPQPPQGATSPTGSGSRGYRNNNWLNIRDTADTWQGETGSDGSFVQFDTPENGLRAADKLLQTYNQKYGLNSVAGVIGRWAPSKENDTAAYVQTVARDLGVDPNAPLNMADPNVRQALIRSMAKVENGFDPFAYREEQAGRPYEEASLGASPPPQGPAPVPRVSQAGVPAPSPSVVKGSAPRTLPQASGLEDIGGGFFRDNVGRLYQRNSAGVMTQSAGINDTAVSKAVSTATGINDTLAALDAYDKAVRQLKPSEFSPLGKYLGDPAKFAAAKAAATNLMMNLKGPEVFALGVVTGPDMSLLESIVADPGKFKTLLTQDQIIPSLTQLASSLGQKRRGQEEAFKVLGGNPAALPKMYLPADTKTVDGKRVQKKAAVPRVAPKPGAVEDGYRFVGGDPANPSNWVKV